MPSRYDYDFPVKAVPRGEVPSHFTELEGAAPHADAVARNLFLRKVFGLVALGLAFTAVGGYFGLTSGLSLQLIRHPFIGFGLYFAIFFGAQAGRHVPLLNVALLAAFTGFTGLMLAPVVALAGPAAAGNALATTCTVFLGLSIYASTTKRDFSYLGAFVFTGILAMIVGQLLNAFVFHSAALDGAFAAVGCFIFSAAILFDVWRLNRTQAFDDPIPFALTLYLDFINLFLYVLRLFSRRD